MRLRFIFKVIYKAIPMVSFSTRRFAIATLVTTQEQSVGKL
ncbi:hypothetical protein [Halotia branconii]|uniref:Uncharacterized protein n=1 Tax=Halotia branconii CENA392 TaxID=1539056 RepID=A0AAJ6NVT7_9CYAN|nr:hypothetical protein [Halotia branconii]WGV27658.1 hypothetical protein QI031_09310 [Halotia branconii CENA392]